MTQMKLLYQTETYSVISFILISIMALASIAIIYLVKKEIDKSENEIINLKKVRGFDLSFTGTICVSLSNGTVTYVSRRYVAKIKQLLGI